METLQSFYAENLNLGNEFEIDIYQRFAYIVVPKHFFMNDINAVMSEIIHFRDERDWEQFHNSKDLALAISIEAAELNELFLWKKAEEVDVAKLKTELADIFTFSFLLAHKHGLDIGDIILEKLKENGLKYPADKARGSAKKYNEL